MPRVIAGTAGGIPLKTPDGDGTRPTTDRTKESVFNMIHADIPGAHVLDLFAGSGSLGIEALSRGACEAVFVESDRRVCDLVQANLAKTRLAGAAQVLCMDVGMAVRKTGRTAENNSTWCLRMRPIGAILCSKRFFCWMKMI